MQNKEIIGRLKKLIPSLKKITGLDHDKLKDLVDETKVCILGLWLDKQDENFRKGVLNMIEDYTAHKFRDYDEILEIKNRLQNILESFIDVMEIREKALEAKENDIPEEGKKSKTKQKSD